MNAMSPAAAPLIPENAPFTGAQRAWLNGFLAGLYGPGQALSVGAAPVAEDEDFPWHDPALELSERQSMAEGKPLARQLMASMAQLDCGQCGYLCQTYAEALAEGKETSPSLCVPGGKPTSKAVKVLLSAAPVAVAVAAVEPVKLAVAPLPRVPVISAARLTAEASAKDVRQIVIDLAGSGLTYEPGDSFGVHCPNDPALVDAVIAALHADAGAMVPCPDGERTLRDALLDCCDIARPHERVTDLLAGVATYPKHAEMLRRISEGEDGAEPADADLLDLLEAFPSARPPVADLVRALPALKPRLYSIASAQAAVGEAVHLCVAAVRTTRRDRTRLGVGSTHLADRAVGAAPIAAYVQSSHFRLPPDPRTPVIMVGPGTGIAPFRAFLQHRAATQAAGRTWLFFGDQHAKTDFLYEDELAAWRDSGVLSRLDVAFSRDQSDKIYVQNRMREQAGDLWRWLQDGAHFYVCGDASRMAKDVDTALRGVAVSEGGLTDAQAKDWIVALARQGRYQRDVY